MFEPETKIKEDTLLAYTLEVTLLSSLCVKQSDQHVVGKGGDQHGHLLQLAAGPRPPPKPRPTGGSPKQPQYQPSKNSV